ncbi:MAG: hypothetical protein ACR2LQ_09190 [Acidimicrobiales bacterium]
MRKLIVLLAALGAFVLAAPAAEAKTPTITIETPAPPGPSVRPTVTPAQLDITAGDTVTFDNKDAIPHTITFRTGGQSFSVPANGTYVLPPVSSSFDYYVDNFSGPAGVGGSVVAAPAPATTTPATVAPTTTSAPATTTTAKATTTTASSTTSSTTTSTSSTTTSLPTVVAKDNTGGGNNSAVWLALAALVVAGLAGAAFFAYRRSQEPPFDDDAEAWDNPDDWSGEPPTQAGPTV